MDSQESILDLKALFDELFPLCRSLTGPGYDQSLAILQRYVPFEIEEYPCGSTVFDWTVPYSWQLKRAVLKDLQGNIILDSDVNPICVVNYSESFHGQVSLDELKEHLFTDSNYPSATPYVISYYKKRWGFCLSLEQFETLKDPAYIVDIDTVFSDQGSVKVGVCDLPGESDRIVLLSSYLCHPNMFNNELSGPLGLVYLYHLLKALPKRNYTYRFVINPETIGSVCYLSRHSEELKAKLEYGVVLTCIGAPYNSETFKSGKIVHDIKPIDLNKPYFELIETIGTSYQRNFLDLPLSFKMTRQSMCDELKYTYQQQNKQCLNNSEHSSAMLNPNMDYDALKGSANSALTISGSNSLNTKDLKSVIEKTIESESSDRDNMNPTHYVCYALFDPEISDEDTLAIYQKCERIWDKQLCSNYHALSKAVPHGAEHLFKYTFEIDNILAHLFNSSPERLSLRRFTATSGSDERQYCSALINLPVVQVTRTQYACYPFYHTDKDNLECFSLDSVVDSALGIFRCLQYLEHKHIKPRISVCCEPQLGKRGLYPNVNSPKMRNARNSTKIHCLDTLLTILNICDGQYDIDELAFFANVSPLDLIELIENLFASKLLTCA